MAVIPSEAHPILWNFGLGLAVLVGILSLTVKLVLYEHEFPVSFIWHFSDIPNLYRLARRELNPVRRFRYLTLFVSLCVTLVVFAVVGFILLFVSG